MTDEDRKVDELLHSQRLRVALVWGVVVVVVGALIFLVALGTRRYRPCVHRPSDPTSLGCVEVEP